MKSSILILLLAASTVAASAQTPAKPATSTAAKPATTSAAKPAVKHTTAAARCAVTTLPKLPAGLPAVKGVPQTAFSLIYQDILVGSGAVAEPNKLYKVHYTGWLAADGRKFDSSYDHPRQPVLDKDGKPVLGADGKPKEGEPQPISFPQGYGRVIPGWDQAFGGMKIGGKRRIFIPWQLAYGAKGRPTNDPKNPGIPAKADLIFDVELIDVSELPTPPNRPGGRQLPNFHPQPGTQAKPGASATPGAAAAPATPAKPAAPAATPAAASPAAPVTAPVASTPAPAPAAPAATQPK
jgi:peptidylprolyl isomerase